MGWSGGALGMFFRNLYKSGGSFYDFWFDPLIKREAIMNITESLRLRVDNSLEYVFI